MNNNLNNNSNDLNQLNDLNNIQNDKIIKNNNFEPKTEEELENEIIKLNKKIKKEKILNIFLIAVIVIIIAIVSYAIYYVFSNFLPYYKIARNNKDIDKTKLISTNSQIDSGLIDLDDVNNKLQVIDNYVNMAFYYQKDNKKIIDEMFKG